MESELAVNYGLLLEWCDGHALVRGLEPESLAHRQARVGKGFILSQLLVGGQTLELTEELIVDTCALWGSVPVGSTVHLEFTRPPMEIPLHGSCRKGIHKSTNPRLTQEQTSWLTTTILESNHRVRDKEATNLMAHVFGGWYNVKTRQPLWLSQDQIASWISRSVAARKKSVQQASGKRVKGVGPTDQGQKAASKKRPQESESTAKGLTSNTSTRQNSTKQQKVLGSAVPDEHANTVGDVIDLSAGLDEDQDMEL